MFLTINSYNRKKKWQLTAPHGVNIAIVGGLIAGLIAFFLCCTCVCATCFYCGKNTAQGTGLSTEEVQKWHTQMRIIEPYCSTREPELDTVWVLQGDGANGTADGSNMRSPNGSSTGGGGRLSPNPSPGRRSSHEDGGAMGGGIGGGGGGGGMGHGHGDDGGMGGGGGGRHGGGQNNKNKKPGQKKSGTKGSKK